MITAKPAVTIACPWLELRRIRHFRRVPAVVQRNRGSAVPTCCRKWRGWGQGTFSGSRLLYPGHSSRAGGPRARRSSALNRAVPKATIARSRPGLSGPRSRLRAESFPNQRESRRGSVTDTNAAAASLSRISVAGRGLHTESHSIQVVTKLGLGLVADRAVLAAAG